jgi:hypothetical protein
MHTHDNSNGQLEELITNSYKDFVFEEFQYLFNFNFRLFVLGIRVVFKKIMVLITDY